MAHCADAWPSPHPLIPKARRQTAAIQTSGDPPITNMVRAVTIETKAKRSFFDALIPVRFSSDGNITKSATRRTSEPIRWLLSEANAPRLPLRTQIDKRKSTAITNVVSGCLMTRFQYAANLAPTVGSAAMLTLDFSLEPSAFARRIMSRVGSVIGS